MLWQDGETEITGLWDYKGKGAKQECYIVSKAGGSSVRFPPRGQIWLDPNSSIRKGELGVLKLRYFIICRALLSQRAGAISSRLQPRTAMLLL